MAELETIGVKVTIQGVSDYNASAQRVTRANQDMAASGTAMASKLNASSMAFAAVGVAAVAAGGMIAGMAVKTGLGLASMLEQSEISFKTMLGSEQAAKKYLKELYDFAAKTPFEFKNLVGSTQRLLAMGFAAEEVIPSLRAIGDTAAALGAGTFGIDRMVRALGQMKAKGKVSAEEMMQLAEMGVPAWQMLANVIGTDIPTAMKMAQKGAISAEKAVAGLMEQMTAKYGGMMEEQSTTMQGLFSTLKDTAEMAMANMMKPFLPMLKQFIGDATAMAAAIGPVFVNAGAGAAVIMQYLRSLAPIIIMVTGLWLAHAVAAKLAATSYATLAKASIAQVGVLGTLGRGISGIAGSLMTFNGALVAATVAYAGLDIGLKAFTGYGITDYLFGNVSAQKMYNAALKEYGTLQEHINDLLAVGANQEKASRLAKIQAIADIRNEAAAIENAYGEDFQKIKDTEPFKGIFRDQFKFFHDQIMNDVKPSLSELNTIIGDSSILATIFADDIKDMKKALGILDLDNEVQRFKSIAAALGYVEKTTKGAGDAMVKSFSGVKSAADSLTDLFTGPDPTLEYLKLEQAELENLKKKFSETWSPTQEAQLQAVTDKIALQGGETDILGARLSVFGATLAKTLGASGAAGLIDTLADKITDLPENQQLFIKMLLPTMEMQQLYTFLMLISKGVTVPIAMVMSTNIDKAMSSIGKLPTGIPDIISKKFEKALGLTGTGVGLKDIVGNYNAVTDAIKKTEEEINDMAGAYDGLGGSAGGASKELSESEKTLLDLMNTLQQSNITGEQFKNEMNFLSSSANQLDMSFEEIVDVFRRSGLSVSEFNDRCNAAVGLAKLQSQATEAADAVNMIYDALNKLYSQPSKEEAVKNWQMAWLKRDRAAAIAAGEDKDSEHVKSIDAAIEGLQNELDVRRADIDIMKAEADMRNASLLTQAEQDWAAKAYIEQIGTLSQTSAALNGQLFWSTASLWTWTQQMGNWMDAAEAALAAAPTFQSGGTIPGPIGRPMMIIAHGGEKVISRAQLATTSGASQRGEMGIRGGGIYNYGTQNFVFPGIHTTGDFSRELDRNLRN